MALSMRGTGVCAEDTLLPDNSETSHPSLLGLEYSALAEEEDHAREVSSWKILPWWRRPSPYWVIFGVFFGTIGSAALLAPKVAMYTALVCRVHRPEYNRILHSSMVPLTRDLVSVYAANTPNAYAFDGSVTTVDTTLLPTFTLGYTTSTPDSDQKCASDPVVQAVVARLSAVFTTSTGILSCLTAGWWGSLSDRYGRRIVLFVSIFGLFVVECAHVITAWFLDILPGGYWFPLVGFLIEGLCGGMSSGVAMSHAYLADTTDSSTRSRFFSLALGLMFTGVAVGPALGGLLIRSSGTILSVFYFSVVLHGVYIIFLLFILPEPLTRARAKGACMRWRQEKANETSHGRTLNVLKGITKLFKPLSILLPERTLERRNWNLFFLSIAYALITNAMGVLSYKVQYAAAQFGWTPDITSYYVSMIGSTRAVYLTVLLPLIIKYFEPAPAPVQLPSTSDEPLQDTMGSSRGAAQIGASDQRFTASRSPVFDLLLTRVSVGLETMAFLGMTVASTGTLFALASTVTSFAAGFSPAAQALALDIYTNRRSPDRGETGKLYGALGVLQALGSQIISPALYGFVYSNTVAVFPQAIMIVSTCTCFLALIFLFLVCAPSKSDPVTPRDRNERGSQDTETLLAMENEIEGG